MNVANRVVVSAAVVDVSVLLSMILAGERVLSCGGVVSAELWGLLLGSL